MPDQNGFMTAQDTRAEWVAAEVAQRARRDPAQIAAEPTSAESAQRAAMDARLAEAVAGTHAARRALVTAQGSVEGWATPTPAQARAIVEAERALTSAVRDEEDVLRDSNELGFALSVASQARRRAAR